MPGSPTRKEKGIVRWSTGGRRTGVFFRARCRTWAKNRRRTCRWCANGSASCTSSGQCWRYNIQVRRIRPRSARNSQTIVRIAHISDTHLGYTRYAKLHPETGRNQREVDVQEAYARAVDAILERDVDLVIHSGDVFDSRSEEHTSELQSRQYLVCRLLLEK